MADQLALDGCDGLGDGVPWYVYAPDGTLIDVIEDVVAGDRLAAAEAGRESWHTAALWAHVAADQWKRERRRLRAQLVAVLREVAARRDG